MPSELVQSGFLFGLGGRYMSVRLELLKNEDEEQFIKDNQFAFKYGAKQYFSQSEMEEQYEEEGEISLEKPYTIPFIIKVQSLIAS